MPDGDGGGDCLVGACVVLLEPASVVVVFVGMFVVVFAVVEVA